LADIETIYSDVLSVIRIGLGRRFSYLPGLVDDPVRIVGKVSFRKVCRQKP
jgi:hypothetical protein